MTRKKNLSILCVCAIVSFVSLPPGNTSDQPRVGKCYAQYARQMCEGCNDRESRCANWSAPQREHQAVAFQKPFENPQSCLDHARDTTWTCADKLCGDCNRRSVVNICFCVGDQKEVCLDEHGQTCHLNEGPVKSAD